MAATPGNSLFLLYTGSIPNLLRKKLQILVSKKCGSFSDFMTEKKHLFYHLWKGKTRCCQCQSGINITRISEGVQLFFKFFEKVSKKKDDLHKMYRNGIWVDICICCFLPIENLTDEVLDSLDFSFLTSILLNSGYLSSTEEQNIIVLRKYRNNHMAHATAESLRDLPTLQIILKEIENIFFDTLQNSGIEDVDKESLKNDFFQQYPGTSKTVSSCRPNEPDFHETKELSTLLNNDEVSKIDIFHSTLEEKDFQQHPGTPKIMQTVSSSCSFEIDTRHLEHIMEMSVLLDDDRFEEFECFRMTLQEKEILDKDLNSHICYQVAHKHVHMGEYDKALETIDEGLKLSISTTNPKYFEMQMLTVRARTYVNLNFTEELEDTVNVLDAIFLSDKLLFPGKIAGWFFYDKSRFFYRKFLDINRNKETRDEMDVNFCKAKNSIEHSIYYFESVNVNDSEECLHNIGTAKIQLAYILLRCSEDENVYNVVKPSEDDIKVGKILLFDHIEDSNIPMDNSLEFQFVLVKFHFYLRTGKKRRCQELKKKLENIARESKRKKNQRKIENLQKILDLCLK